MNDARENLQNFAPIYECPRQTTSDEDRKVVLDPENYADTSRLADAIKRRWMTGSDWMEVAVARAILNELLPPTKPEEPRRRYAEVLDRDGSLWTRMYAPGAGRLRVWAPDWAFTNRPLWRDWEDIDAVTVKWEGKP